MNRFEGLEIVKVRTIQRIRPLCLGDDYTRHRVYKTQVFHHEEAAAEGRNVAQITTRDNDDVRQLPFELLAYLDADCLLPLDAQ